MGQSKFAVLFLIFAAALLGLTYPLIANTMHKHDPYHFVALRFMIASAIMLPYFLRYATKELLLVGGTLGLLNCASYLTQTFGLQMITASRAAFLMGTYVIFIAILAPIFRIQSLTKRDVFCALFCTLGIYILTGCDTSQLTMGDGWTIICAIIIAVTIMYVCQVSKRNYDPVLLVSTQIIATGIFSLCSCLVFSDLHFEGLQNLSFWLPLIYCSIFATIFTFFLQIKYQKYLSVQKVALIWCMEPVFASFFDWMINGTHLNLYTLLGGSIILLSIILQLQQSPKESVINEQNRL